MGSLGFGDWLWPLRLEASLIRYLSTLRASQWVIQPGYGAGDVRDAVYIVVGKSLCVIVGLCYIWWSTVDRKDLHPLLLDSTVVNSNRCCAEYSGTLLPSIFQFHCFVVFRTST